MTGTAHPRVELLLAQIRRTAAETCAESFVFKSEYLGYLPFGQYQWIEVGDVTLDTDLPDGWSLADLQALTRDGALEQVSEERGKFEPEDHWVTFRIK